MKTKVVLTLCLVFVLRLVFSVSASAQVKAGSDEDRALTAIDAETNTDAKLAKLQNFEKTFPTSVMLPSIYQMEIDVYKQKNDPAKINEVGEKLIKADPQNILALLAVSRNYAMTRTNLTVAVDYAQRAVAAVAKLKTTPAPPNQTSEEWQQYLTTMDNAAKAQLNYAKSVHP